MNPSELVPRGASAPVMLAPVASRLAAFAVDLVVLAVALGVAGLNEVTLTWPLIAGTFVGYHGVLIWLNERTLGKAVFGLRVQRSSGRPYRRRPVGLLWALGRAGLGYLVFDGFFVVGLVCVLRDPQRRATHDMMFHSQVVMVAADLETAEARWGLRHKARAERLARENEKNIEELKPRNPVVRLLMWLVGRVAALSVLLSWLRRAWRWLIHRLLGPEKGPLSRNRYRVRDGWASR